MKILVGVCGSVSAYKSIEFVRGLVKKGHEVKVILTSGATKFVHADLYTYLGAAQVYSAQSDFSGSVETKSVLHIELAKWADSLHIYPASANTTANLAMGKADDLLTSIFLAGWDKFQTIIYPAMNTSMWTNPITQENIDLLERLNKQSNIFIYPPASGELACGDVGAGKIPAVEEVLANFDAINPSINESSKRVVITAGATVAPIDPVRFVTNPSSGKTGYEIAKESLRLGYQTTILLGQNSCPEFQFLKSLPGVKIISVRTTDEMYEAVLALENQFDTYISTAAISDLKFKTAEGKLKKEALSSSLEFEKAQDVLAHVVANKLENQIIVGFAAETDLSKEVLESKYNRKPTKLLIGTHVDSGLCKSSRKGFGNNEAYYTILNDGVIAFTGELSKIELAKEIFKRIKA
ncbi:bifunctional phosphopantothenoylcysteine decarboxylase/phosphopantothenate--cysteine ligase CoaBC [Halobacteriovorax sp. DA5]|uniref:bifunctional phosphopantothenoylcysteine decarboxylase/phosphopantothenate--cysteine ligase CoaBC n=1 Tax=Halobacteriovorax sp. DA5 TaxID=2067553 RepID=UPI000CD0C1E1|nr:bifunctional phosphopantothenoylcysteine decarboxylase/phosphopantothenate--cysteine ligase CoaBC [Halobacteriovorax sp. DA5]POB13967.1 bifunctional phosphopantothenoylcysteine decarboxylase/phosphopantothenate--cysteine ligase CoaBC [Halobacteriovorax sp. DA5]